MKSFNDYKNKYVGYNTIGEIKGMIRSYNIGKGRTELNEKKELEAKKDFLELKKNLDKILYGIINNMESDKKIRGSDEFERTLKNYQLNYPVERDLKHALNQEYNIKKNELLNDYSIYDNLKRENDIILFRENNYNEIINVLNKKLDGIEKYIDKLHFLALFEDSINDVTKKEGYIQLMSEYLNEYLRSFEGLFKDPENYKKILELLENKKIIKKKKDQFVIEDYVHRDRTYKKTSLLTVILVDLINKNYIKKNIDDYILAKSFSKSFNINISAQFFGQIKNQNVNKEPYFKILNFIPFKKTKFK